MGSTWVGNILAHKYLTRVEMGGKDKRTSLQHFGTIYYCEKFYRKGPWRSKLAFRVLNQKTSYRCNRYRSLISCRVSSTSILVLNV